MSPRFVEYIRVSGQNQAERETQEIQRQSLIRLRERRPGSLIRGLGVTGAHEDLAISGAKGENERPAWAAVCDLIRAKKVDEVRVVAIDRLTRSDSPGDWGAFVQTFVDSDTIIVEANGAITDVRHKGGMDALMLMVRAMGAGDERKRISKRFFDGRRAAATRPERGAGAWGRVPFGYAFRQGVGYVQDHTPLADGWTPVKVIRRSFELLAEHSCQQAARILTAEGVPAPGGRKWSRTTLNGWVRNTTFKGKLQGFLPPETDDRGNPLPAPPGVEVHTEPDGSQRWRFNQEVEPIVSEATWDAALRATSGRKNQRRADFREVDALFRYHLTCGGCGGRLLALNQSVRGIRYPRYKCQGRHCTQRAAYVIEAVDATVWGVLIDGLCRPGGLAVSATAQPAATGNPTERIAEAVARRKAQQAEIDDLVASFASAPAAVRLSVSARLVDLGKRIEHWDRVIAEQEALRDQHEEFAQRAALAEHRLSAIRRSLGQELTFSQRRRIVDILFANGGGRVLVHPAEGRRARLEVVCDLLAPRPTLAGDNIDTPPEAEVLRVVPANSRRCTHACTPDRG